MVSFSLLVYLGLQFDRERAVNVILVLIMLITGGFTLFHAIERFFAPFEPAVDWFTFTATIVSALVCAGLWAYQRYVGINSGSLALITQSVDSRNHVIIAGSVTAGLIASMLNFGLLDTLVGLAVAILILKSAIELGIEVIRSLGDEDVDFSHYKMDLVERYDRFRQSQFRDWMLYLVDSENGMTRSELVRQAEQSLDYGDNIVLRSLDLHEQEGAGEMVETSLSELFESEWLAGEEQLCLTEAGSAYLRKRMSRRWHGRDHSTWHPGRRRSTPPTIG